MPKIPKKRYAQTSGYRISFIEKLFIRAQWAIARNTNRLWIQSNRDMKCFNRLSRILRSRLTWVARFSSLFDDPVVTLKKWAHKIVS